MKSGLCGVKKAFYARSPPPRLLVIIIIKLRVISVHGIFLETSRFGILYPCVLPRYLPTTYLGTYLLPT